MSIIIADIIYYFHIIIVIFILFGNFFIPNRYLPHFIAFVIFVMLNWYGLFGSCILTKLEYYFRTGVWSKLTAEDEGGPEFFRPLIKSVFGIELTRYDANRLNNILFLLVILIAFINI
jgi:hypothetical protein